MSEWRQNSDSYFIVICKIFEIIAQVAYFRTILEESRLKFDF